MNYRISHFPFSSTKYVDIVPISFSQSKGQKQKLHYLRFFKHPHTAQMFQISLAIEDQYGNKIQIHWKLGTLLK